MSDLPTPPSVRATKPPPASRELLAERIGAGRRRRQGRDEGTLPHGIPEGPQPLSFAQERLWFLDRLEPGNPAYHIARAWALDGPLDRRGLALALARLAARHPALRTVFVAESGEPWQEIQPAPEPRLPVVDLGGLPEEGREAAALALARREAQRPFDLARGPAFRAVLVARAEGRSLLFLTLHHIAADGGSMPVVYRNLGALYGQAIGEAGSLPPEPAVAYASYAAWQRRRLDGAAVERLLGFWRREPRGSAAGARAAGRPAAAPPLLAARRRRAAGPASGDGRGPRPPGPRAGATPFMVLLAGFAALLGRYTGRRNLLLGTPVGNRPRRELEEVVGLFVNTAVLRLAPRGEMVFAALVAEARKRAISAYSHQELPFERLVEELAEERDLSRTALFQVMFLGLDGGEGTLALPGLAVERLPLAREESKFDLTLAVIEEQGASFLHAQYSTDLFDPGRIRRLLGHLATLLTAAVEEPETRLSDLPLLAPAERERLAAWGRGAREPMPEVSVGELCRAGAAGREEAVAITWADEHWSYASFWRHVDHLASHLLDQGVAPEAPVGVLLERTPELAIAALAILEVGGVYLPLDPSLPAARIEGMLEDAQPALVITDRESPLAPQSFGVSLVAEPVILSEAKDLGGGSTGEPFPRSFAALRTTRGQRRPAQVRPLRPDRILRGGLRARG